MHTSYNHCVAMHASLLATSLKTVYRLQLVRCTILFILLSQVHVCINLLSSDVNVPNPNLQYVTVFWETNHLCTQTEIHFAYT